VLKPPPELTPAQQQSDSVIYSTLKQAALVAGKTGLESVGVPAIPAAALSTGLVTAVDTIVKKKGDLLKPHKITNIENAPIFL
jgi:O-acetyl-ADP-ribose deacetylase (regulator of RNase III)